MNLKLYTSPEQIEGRELKREVETLLKCDHPAIPKVTEFGTARENEEFLITTLPEGETLADRVASGRKLSLSESVYIFRQVFDCLEHLDEEEIFHGFISPENILVEPNNKVALLGVGATPRESKPFSISVSDPETGNETIIEHGFENHTSFPRFLDWHRTARCLAFGLYGEDLLKATHFDLEYDHQAMANRFSSLRPDLPGEIGDFLALTMTQNGTFSHFNSFFLRFAEVASKYTSLEVKGESWWGKARKSLIPPFLR